MKNKIIGKNGVQIVSLNRRKAIHEKYLNCSAWSPKDVAGCKMNSCPLYSYRTSKGKQNAKERQKSIRTYCVACMNGHVGAVLSCQSSDCPLFIYRKGGVDKLARIFMKKNFNHEAEPLLSHESRI